MFAIHFCGFTTEEDPIWPYLLAGSLIALLLAAVLVGILLWQR